MADWAEEHGIKPGSRVVVCEGGRSGGVSKRLVVRMTKTLIILDNDRRFRRRDGHESGTGTDWQPSASLALPHDPYVVDQMALLELKRLMATLNRAASGNHERIQVLKTLRTMRYEIKLAWEKLGGDDTGPLED